MITVCIVSKSASSVRVRVEGVPTYRGILVNPGSESDDPEGEPELAGGFIDIPISEGATADAAAAAWAGGAYGVAVSSLLDLNAAVSAVTDVAGLKAVLIEMIESSRPT